MLLLWNVGIALRVNRQVLSYLIFEQSKVMIFTQLQTKKGRERPCIYMTLTKTLTKFNQHPQH